MILRILKILKFFLLIVTSASAQSRPMPRCLTGYMTDVQSWVGVEGGLTKEVDAKSAIDLSSQFDPVPLLHQKMTTERRTRNDMRVRYLSLAKCRLTRVPPVFHLPDAGGRWLAQTIEYITFYGNVFVDISRTGEQYNMNMNATGAVEVDASFSPRIRGSAVWSISFEGINFPTLKELDLRACSIQVLRANMFREMPALEALYIGENEIYHIEADAFVGLNRLRHLDISRNVALDDKRTATHLFTPPTPIFSNLTRLVSLDLSYTKLSKRNAAMLRDLGPNLRRLSICDTGFNALSSDMFENTNLNFLDVSRNGGILNTPDVLRGLEDKLQVVYASFTNVQQVDMFKNFTKLEILNLFGNEIVTVPTDVAATWTKLQILDLNKNRMTTWFEPTFSLMPNLQFLLIRDNNINVIREPMMKDFKNISYIAMAGNFIICNCHSRDFLELAARNELIHKHGYIRAFNKLTGSFMYHKGFEEFNQFITSREPVTFETSNQDYYSEDESQYLITDFDVENYVCLSVKTSEGEAVFFGEVAGCKSNRDMMYEQVITKSRYQLLAMITLPFLLFFLVTGYMFRRNIFYFLIVMRNTAMLTLINKDKIVVDGKIFNYDVFVSYCNEDRAWVLDHLLPQLEADCSISACLHERDFQVGLSILENIVSCMDRSRTIMLVISEQFLRSQWCQFEMHLAQHRLLETRREDLVLVLLEDIPRRIRPTTLHYLMLTKTYIIWPKDIVDRNIFWRRLRKGLVTQKLKQTDNVSLA